MTPAESPFQYTKIKALLDRLDRKITEITMNQCFPTEVAFYQSHCFQEVPHSLLGCLSAWDHFALGAPSRGY